MLSDAGQLHAASGGGIAGSHASAPEFQFLVSPATGNERNTARLRPIPVACWRVDDIRFDFDSSFVTPDIGAELQILVNLRDAHKQQDANGKVQYPPLSIFGHADPVGSDDYNKDLSGRRAAAIYALLLSGTDSAKAAELWAEIASTEKWGRNQGRVMQSTTGLPADTPPRQLFTAYMDKLRPAALQLTTSDFLAQGADSGGKGDYQGCSEFNPLLIFSQEKQTQFEQGQNDQAVLAERNSANSPNRRVLVLLFRTGSKVDPAKWPCPRASEGASGCKKRFWSDGEQRRSDRLAQEDRRFETTQDTFACRFFQRLSSGSPCQAMMRYFRVRLYDPTGKYIAFAPYRVTIGQTTQPVNTADEKGLIAGQDLQVPNRCVVEWAFPPVGEDAEKPVERFPFKASVFLSLDPQDDETRNMQMLNNLGYPIEDPRETNVTDFQTDFSEPWRLQPSGEIDTRTKKAIQQIHSKCDDDLRATKPEPGSGGQN